MKFMVVAILSTREHGIILIYFVNILLIKPSVFKRQNKLKVAPFGILLVFFGHILYSYFLNYPIFKCF